MYEKEIEKFRSLYWDIVKKEKNIYIFKYKWLDCAILRHMWHLNWYVAVPEWHTFRWMSYFYSSRDDKWLSEEAKYINGIKVHWWLTFGGALRLYAEWYNFTYCFGFDTGHARDCFSDWRYANCPDDWEYRDYNYVRSEVESLAEQIYNYK